jgi:Skp family chaperone for outer membrane proteins
MVVSMRFIAVIMMVLGLSVAMPVQQAHAQAAQGSIVVLDTQALLANSAAGRSLAQQLQAIQQQMVTELTTEERAIRDEETRLQQAASGLSRDQLLSNSTLTSQMAANDRRAQALQQRAEANQRDLGYTQMMAAQDFNRQLTPILNEVMTARGATIVLDRSAVVTMADGNNITQDVITRLDQRVPSVTVTRQTAPPPQQ